MHDNRVFTLATAKLKHFPKGILLYVMVHVRPLIVTMERENEMRTFNYWGHLTKTYPSKHFAVVLEGKEGSNHNALECKQTIERRSIHVVLGSSGWGGLDGDREGENLTTTYK